MKTNISKKELAEEGINVAIGETCFVISCTDKDILQYLKNLYRKFLCDSAPDMYVKIGIIDTLAFKTNSKSINGGSFFHDNGVFNDTAKLVSGNYDLSSGTVDVLVEKQLIDSNIHNSYLNQLICKLYYSALKIRKIDVIPAFIVHSSAVIYESCGLLFTGPSGIGKTTIANMISTDNDALVINDEGNLVSRSIISEQITIQGIPVIGKSKEHNNTNIPLKCILFLAKSKKMKFYALEKTDAFKRLLRQVVGNIYFGQNDRKSAYTSIADFCEDIITHVPCFELEFTLEPCQIKHTINSLIETL